MFTLITVVLGCLVVVASKINRMTTFAVTFEFVSVTFLPYVTVKVTAVAISKITCNTYG